MGEQTFQKAFLAHDPTALRLLPRDLRHAASRLAHVKKARSRRVSDDLLAELRQQQAALPPSAPRQRNLQRLADGAAVIAAGQQVGLFLGPLYTFYKAASAIAWAQRLEAETALPCVPLFWLQTEDHDFEEINHCHVPLTGGDWLTLTLAEQAAPAPSEAHAAKISVAHRRLGPAISGVHAQLRAALEGFPHAEEVLADLAATYRTGRGWAEAFAVWIARLFADEGLLVVNPRTHGVAKVSAPLFEMAWDRHQELTTALLARDAELRQAGFTPQVHVRPDSPLPFFHPHGALGPRFRLRKQPGRGGWLLIDGIAATAVDAGVPLATLRDDPMTMSSSALLRPLLQDWLLPVAGVVAGPSELAYYAQVEPAYGLLAITPGLVLPRAHFCLVEPRVEELRQLLGLKPADIELPDHELHRWVAERAAGDLPTPRALQERLLAPFRQELHRFSDALGSLGTHLEPSLTKTRNKVSFAVERLSRRYEQAILERDQVAAQRLRHVCGALMPLGKPQERHYSLPYYLARHGLDQVKGALLSALDPLSNEVHEIHLG